MGLAVAWADRELDGWLLDVFYETVDLEALGTEAAELKKIGERCPEFTLGSAVPARRHLWRSSMSGKTQCDKPRSATGLRS